jgi:hypothetical protein
VIDKQQKEQPGPVPLTRRDFVTRTIGAGAALAAGGAVALTGSALTGCASSEGQAVEGLVSKSIQDEDIVALAVSSEQVIEATEFVDAPFEDYLVLQETFELPFGSLVHQLDSSKALVLLPGGKGEPLRKIATLNLGNGELTTLLDKPVGTSKNAVIYEARASRTRLIWVEFDLGDRSWRTYVMPLGATTAGEAWRVDEGDSDYEPPMLAVGGDKVYWTHMPVATGAANMEDSLLKALGAFEQNASSGQGAGGLGEPYTLFTSHGRMITNPLVTDGIVTFVPRVDTANVSYQLTALTCADDTLVDFQILPQSLRVSEAVYMREAFSFTIEGNYDYAGGLSRFGTYRQLEDGTYLHVGRPPFGPSAYFGGCLIVKSTLSIVGFDPVARRSFIIEIPPRCSNYGEALVSWGVQDRVVTSYQRMAEQGGGVEATMVRVFAPAL